VEVNSCLIRTATSRDATYKNEIGSKTDEEGPNDRHDPMHLVVCRPAVDEEAESHAGAKPDHEQEAVLRLGLVYAIGLHARCLDSRIQGAENDHTQYQRDAQP